MGNKIVFEYKDEEPTIPDSIIVNIKQSGALRFEIGNEHKGECNTCSISFDPNQESFDAISNFATELNNWVEEQKDIIDYNYIIEKLDNMRRFYDNRDAVPGDTAPLSFGEYINTVAPVEDRIETYSKMRCLSKPNRKKLRFLGYTLELSGWNYEKVDDIRINRKGNI